MATPCSRPIQQRQGDIGPAGPHVEHGQRGPIASQALDGAGRQANAAQPAIDPLQVAQIPAQDGGIAQASIQQLLGVDGTAHRAKPSAVLDWTEHTAGAQWIRAVW